MLRIRGARGNPEVAAALVRFARWLRREFEFPVRVVVYLSRKSTLVTIDGEEVSASFFAPDDPEEFPYIRIATGDYNDLFVEHGRDNTLASYLCSLAHEVVHYRQWIETDSFTEEGVVELAEEIVDRYALTTDHP